MVLACGRTAVATCTGRGISISNSRQLQRAVGLAPGASILSIDWNYNEAADESSNNSPVLQNLNSNTIPDPTLFALLRPASSKFENVAGTDVDRLVEAGQKRSLVKIKQSLSGQRLPCTR